MNKTGLIAKISITYGLPTCIWKYFWEISRYFPFFGEFRGISRKYLNFAGPRPREISEALIRSQADTTKILEGGYNKFRISIAINDWSNRFREIQQTKTKASRFKCIEVFVENKQQIASF